MGQSRLDERATAKALYRARFGRSENGEAVFSRLTKPQLTDEDRLELIALTKVIDERKKSLADLLIENNNPDLAAYQALLSAMKQREFISPTLESELTKISNSNAAAATVTPAAPVVKVMPLAVVKLFLGDPTRANLIKYLDEYGHTDENYKALLYAPQDLREFYSKSICNEKLLLDPLENVDLKFQRCMFRRLLKEVDSIDAKSLQPVDAMMFFYYECKFHQAYYVYDSETNRVDRIYMKLLSLESPLSGLFLPVTTSSRALVQFLERRGFAKLLADEEKLKLCQGVPGKDATLGHEIVNSYYLDSSIKDSTDFNFLNFLDRENKCYVFIEYLELLRQLKIAGKSQEVEAILEAKNNQGDSIYMALAKRHSIPYTALQALLESDLLEEKALSSFVQELAKRKDAEFLAGILRFVLVDEKRNEKPLNPNRETYLAKLTAINNSRGLKLFFQKMGLNFVEVVLSVTQDMSAEVNRNDKARVLVFYNEAKRVRASFLTALLFELLYKTSTLTDEEKVSCIKSFKLSSELFYNSMYDQAIFKKYFELLIQVKNTQLHNIKSMLYACTYGDYHENHAGSNVSFMDLIQKHLWGTQEDAKLFVENVNYILFQLLNNGFLSKRDIKELRDTKECSKRLQENLYKYILSFPENEKIECISKVLNDEDNQLRQFFGKDSYLAVLTKDYPRLIQPKVSVSQWATLHYQPPATNAPDSNGVGIAQTGVERVFGRDAL